MHCILQAAAVYSDTTSAASHYVTSEKRGGIKCGACPQKQDVNCSNESQPRRGEHTDSLQKKQTPRVCRSLH